MKYLVIKGWLGFGDRLESTKMAIYFAKEHNLKVYIDWTDSIWNHSGESFYSYFSLQNIPTLNSLDDIPSDATVYPSYWKDHLKEPFSEELFGKIKEYKLEIGTLNTKLKESINADVIVLSCIGNRTLFNDSSFFANIFRVIHPSIINEVKRRQQTYNLSNCMGIHIRGTDRIKKRRGREIPIQYIVVSAVSSGAFSGKPIIAISDDPVSFQIWKNYFPQTVLLSNLSLENSSSKGNHNLNKDDLKASKNELNIDMLIDFFTLASCDQIKSTYSDSRFFKEAIRLKPFIKQILQ